MNSDDEIRDLIRDAGLPAKYQRKDLSINSLPATAAALLTAEIEKFSKHRGTDSTRWFFTGPRGLEAAYLYVRALRLLRFPAAVTSVPELLSDAGNPWSDEDRLWADNQVIVLTGFTESGGARLPGAEDRLYGVHWFLRKWMDSGKFLMFHGEVKPKPEPHPWWGLSLMREVAKTTTILEVTQ